jgi:hypothetical protein
LGRRWWGLRGGERRSREVVVISFPGSIVQVADLIHIRSTGILLIEDNLFLEDENCSN